jgi:sirohydrochlorin cobaltochelatase
MAAEVSAQFPGLPVAWAYTAHKVRRKLTAMGQNYDSVAVALSRLHDDGVTHLAVQSLHTVPGVEYHWTRNQALAFVHPRKGFQKVSVGMPLLSSEDDLTLAARGLQSYIPADRQSDEALILVGHGTYHQGQQLYLDFEAVARQHDPLVFLGALMSRPGESLGVTTIIARLKESGISRCHLLPFMSVPGHHVQMDILGDSSRSWQNRLRAEGIEVRSTSTGTLEHKPFRDLWMEHLREAHSRLDQNDAASCCPSHHGDHHAHF